MLIELRMIHDIDDDDGNDDGNEDVIFFKKSRTVTFEGPNLA